VQIGHDPRNDRSRSPEYADEVKRMKKEIKRAVLDCSFGEKALVNVVQDRFMELAQNKFK